MKRCSDCILLVAAIFPAGLISAANAGERKDRPPILPPVASPDVAEDRKVTFRIRAAQSTAVKLGSADIPNMRRGAAMTKGDDGVWQFATEPLAPGAYRYYFDVDGVRAVDPSNPATSESNATTWSLAVVPGSELFDTKDVPHGAVAQATYHSKSLKRPRRMHVYTPPGYEKGGESYPLLYLLHGASDSDASWTSVGRAGFILDNLIAARKAAPMIVVMPTGHTGRFSFAAQNEFKRQMEEFAEDFLNDLQPFIETNYRIRGGRANRAIAGLSMGGMQSLDIAMLRLKDFAYVGVFSSGIFGPNPRQPGPPDPAWEERHKAALDDAGMKQDLRLVWFATGKEDFVIETSRGTVKMLRAHGFEISFKETDGGHTWLNWRDYLSEFVPLLFREQAPAK